MSKVAPVTVDVHARAIPHSPEDGFALQLHVLLHPADLQVLRDLALGLLLGDVVARRAVPLLRHLAALGHADLTAVERVGSTGPLRDGQAKGVGIGLLAVVCAAAGAIAAAVHVWFGEREGEATA